MKFEVEKFIKNIDYDYEHDNTFAILIILGSYFSLIAVMIIKIISLLF